MWAGVASIDKGTLVGNVTVYIVLRFLFSRTQMGFIAHIVRKGIIEVPHLELMDATHDPFVTLGIPF